MDRDALQTHPNLRLMPNHYLSPSLSNIQDMRAVKRDKEKIGPPPPNLSKNLVAQ